MSMSYLQYHYLNRGMLLDTDRIGFVNDSWVSFQPMYLSMVDVQCGQCGWHFLGGPRRFRWQIFGWYRKLFLQTNCPKSYIHTCEESLNVQGSGCLLRRTGTDTYGYQYMSVKICSNPNAKPLSNKFPIFHQT